MKPRSCQHLGLEGQTAIAHDALIDMMAERTGIDPLEFRYINAIRKSEKSSDLDTRIENLNGYFTFSLYNITFILP